MKMGRLKKIYLNCRGMTLVEVLISIAVFAILSVLMAGVFLNAFVLINRAGDLDRTRYTAAKVTENALAGLSSTPQGADLKLTGDTDEIVENTELDSSNEDMIISFPTKDFTVSGEKNEITSNGVQNNVTIEVFIPDED